MVEMDHLSAKMWLMFNVCVLSLEKHYEFISCFALFYQFGFVLFFYATSNISINVQGQYWSTDFQLGLPIQKKK